MYFKLGVQDNVRQQKDEEGTLKGVGLDGKALSESMAAEISPYDQNLAYAPYKGTTIYRKTM